MQLDFAALRERFAAHGQEHVFRFWNALSDAERERLTDRARRVDLDLLSRIRAGLARPRPVPQLEPVAIEPEPAGASRHEARERGEALLAAGRLAVLAVAGGQGTRLGFAGPKAAFPIGPVSGRTLLELHAQKVRRLQRRYASRVPWVVLTSDATHDGIETLLRANDAYGIARDDLFLVKQQMLPVLDFEGRMMLEAPGRIAESPDGHGGAIPALCASGVLAFLEARGVDTLFHHQVDNPLVRLADPVFVGGHDAAGACVSLRAVRKRDAAHQTGTIARVDGRVGVVEYTELPEAAREARDARGGLVFWAGNAAIHLMRCELVRRVAADASRLLPFHASRKRIPCVDADGRRVEPAEPNGYKLERFVFDAFRAAHHVRVSEAQREREYAPLKTAHGESGPAAVRRALVAEYRRWLACAGLEIAGSGAIELDHSSIDGPEDARREGIARRAGEALRIARGVTP